jgi:peptidoglycan/xylan/chitin deacetylase (PgdA/CDA1 family)
MRFAIRDDDTCYFTRVDQLEKVWGSILPYIPVSLAVTPFAVESFHSGDIERFYQGNTPQALDGNPELVDWLKARMRDGSVSVMCHGYTHEYLRVSPRRRLQEYVWKPYERLALETRQSKSYLERVLPARVSTFVPPGNAISRAGLEAVQPYYPNVLTSFSLRRWRDWRLERGSLIGLARRLYYHCRYQAPSVRMENVAGVNLISSFSLTARGTWEQALRRFELCRALGADFVVAVHYWEIDARLAGILRRLLDHATAAGCHFVHCDSLFDSPPRQVYPETASPGVLIS